MKDTELFARLISSAAHELRTPLATVSGFARTLSTRQHDEEGRRYTEMIEAAAAQATDLVEQLSLVTRVALEEYEPVPALVDSLELARSAADELGEERVNVRGDGSSLRVPLKESRRALSQLLRATQRHGGLDDVDVVVRGAEFEIGPVTRSSGPVLLGQQPRDFGAAAAVVLIRELGGSVRVDRDRLVLDLPAEA